MGRFKLKLASSALLVLLVSCLLLSTAHASLEGKAAKQKAKAQLSDAELKIQTQRLKADGLLAHFTSTLDTYGPKLLGKHYSTARHHAGVFSTRAEPLLKRVGVHVTFAWKYLKNVVDHLEAWILDLLVSQKHVLQQYANKDVARILAKVVTAAAAVSIVALVGSLTGSRRQQQPSQERPHR